MKSKKLLYVLIPLLIVVLALIAGVVYLKLNSSPEKIFKNSITKVFSMIEPKKEEFSTVKGTMNFTASVDSDKEEMQEINTMLEGSSIAVDMQADTANMFINENINVTFNNENLLNAVILLQDEKGYVYLKDYLDKYLELPDDTLDYSELSDLYKKSSTLNQNLLMDAIEEELIKTISTQNLLQESTTLVLDGQETKVTASILKLKGTEYITFFREFLENLKINQNFQIALGDYKENVLEALNSMYTDMEADENITFNFTIYTKGFFNQFVGFSGKVLSDDYYQDSAELKILKHNNDKYEFISYEGEREEAKITVQINRENKNKGTAIITVIVDEEYYTFKYNYEKQGNKLAFVLSTELEGVGVSVSGNTIENGNNIKGNMVIAVQEETFGKVNLNYEYDFTYGVQIQKVNTENSVVIDELSEEDQTTLIKNLQKSPLYQLIEQLDVIDSELNTLNDKPEVTNNKYTVAYNIPTNFKSSSYNSNSEDMKMYSDDNYNLISVYIIHKNVNSYLEELEEEYVLKSDFYKNQQISETKKITVNGKEYGFRTITYDDDYGTYVKLYFSYALDDEYCYVVDVKSESGNISMDTIKYFLDVTVSKDSVQDVQNVVNQLEQSTDDRRQDVISGLSGLDI